MKSIQIQTLFSLKKIITFFSFITLLFVYKYHIKENRFFNTRSYPFVADFDSSMKKAEYLEKLALEEPAQFYELCKSLYEKNNFSKLIKSITPRIPKVIHIIWLGGKMPEEYESFVKSWYTFHSNWTIFFWTDNPSNYVKGTKVINSFDQVKKAIEDKERSIVVDMQLITFDNRIFYDQSANYGERSDILKWEIVYRFGGVYVDIDFECLKPLDDFHYYYDFYTGLQPMDTTIVQLGAALFAAIPKHPILKRCVEDIKHSQHIKQIVLKTGPLHFTRSFMQEVGKHKTIDIAFPAGYFYPCMYQQKGTSKERWVQPESYAVHHWAGSWLKPHKA